MKIGGIGKDDNPFLKRLEEDGAASSNVNNPDKAANIDANNAGAKQVGGVDEIKKTGMEEGAASSNMNNNQNSLIDRTQFTSDDELQEIDLQEFEDDFPKTKTKPQTSRKQILHQEHPTEPVPQDNKQLSFRL